MRKAFMCLVCISLVFIFAFSAFAQKTYKMAFMPGIADPFYFTMEKGV